jgi:integrase
LKGLWVHPRSGLRYYRTSRGGKETYVRLPDDLPLDHPDFIAAWAAAARSQDAPAAFPSGTLGSTWRAALASDHLAQLSGSYRAIIQRQANAICAKAGEVKAAAVAERHIRADVRESPNPPARLKAWRFWARYCVEAGWLPTDPTSAIRLRTKGGDGHPTWERAEVEAFRDAYPLGTTPRAIMELTYWTGARISDVVLIGPQHVGKDGVLSFRQSKTRDLAFVPWTCPLPSYARGMAGDRDICHAALAHPPVGMTFLQTAQGRPRSHKAAGHVLANACQAIGLDRGAHGLRKARSAALAEAGATASQIGAWTGHRSHSEIARYTRDMDRRLAVLGVEEEQASGTMPGFSGTNLGKT